VPAPPRPLTAAPLGRGLVLVLGLALVGLAPAPARADLPRWHPSRLAHVGTAGQAVVVTSDGWSSRRAELRAYERTPDGTWRQAMDAGRVWLGWNGFVRADRRRQSTLTTPAGTFRLPWAFGTRPDPGTALPYREVDATDWWPYDPRDPATYNVWQPRRAPASDWRTSWAEDLSSFGGQYRHAVVVGFNLPGGVHRAGGEWVASRTADTRRGGGIFLHVQDREVAARPTAGCVAMPRRRMTALLRWLDPTARPVVVMGPRRVIDRM
jgi:L,D-peptidoglycan transpeptidase YkuD (ErfK/YbiS/YcfS/YnhG family)